MKKCFIYILMIVLCTVGVSAQETGIYGKVTNQSELLAGAVIYLLPGNLHTTTNSKGEYALKGIIPGKYTVNVRLTGYKTVQSEISIVANQYLNMDFNLTYDVLNLNQMVVTGTREEIKQYESPVVVNTIGKRLFENTQAVNLADGLSFSPGLRVENNCQNCGFTQVRMNGLQGPYSQILINSRPVFSALAGVYGLEMLPSGMIDRVEVVRGGGSVLYGGNAIAGTINILTKDPLENQVEFGSNLSFINGNVPDNNLFLNGSLISDDYTKGISFYLFNRNRMPWDANGDGFSEITKLNNLSFGFNTYWNIGERKKIKLNVYRINEFRRGGNGFHLEPHQADVAEQLTHNIFGINLGYDWYSKNYRHKVTLFSAVQSVLRNSYYGGGGRVLTPNDSITESDLLAINAYGNSRDISISQGIQYLYKFNKNYTLIAGSEQTQNQVSDNMPGYNRSINQTVLTWGNYAQLSGKITNKITVTAGLRFDVLNIYGKYNLQDETFNNKKLLPVFVPRITAMYEVNSSLYARVSFAQGYRGPQAFDEDLHIETVGGAARFIRIDNNLKAEGSNSILASLNYQKNIKNKKQISALVEGFFTALNNPFILSDQFELDNGTAVITKRNGEGASIFGVNAEFNFAYKNKWLVQTGLTLQEALYNKNELLWKPSDSIDQSESLFLNRILRTPRMYGFASINYHINKKLNISTSTIFTGSMQVAHVINAQTEQTVLKETPVFIDQGFRVEYLFFEQTNFAARFNFGVQNIFNSFQRDFDRGATRDAGYVYGPIRPFTFYFGIKFFLH
jgi:outer membrane receptor for ferrienterochelin and colicins